MCRKQPIPTSFLSNQSLDIFDRMLFAYLRSKTYNSDQYISFYHGNKYLNFEIKRGQCFFIISELVKTIGISRGRVEKSLKKIQKTENEMQIEKKPYGCLITWFGYDERVKMKNESEVEDKTKQKRNENEVKSSEYSDKSVESVESENTTSEPKPEIIKSKQDLLELYTIEELTATEQIQAKYTFVYEFADRGYDKIPKSKKGIDDFTNKLAEKCTHAIGKIDRNHLRATLRKIKDWEEDNKKKTSNYLSRFNTFLLPKK